ILQTDQQTLNPLSPSAPSALAPALNSILNVSNSDILLRGLNELLGGASSYAVTGSAALAIHAQTLNVEFTRQPADLDIILECHAMECLSRRTPRDLAQFNMECKPGNNTHLMWNASDDRSIKVDVISCSSRTAGSGLQSSVTIDGQRVVAVAELHQNLLNRLDRTPTLVKPRQDVEFIDQHHLLNSAPL
ncbi:MAG: hypothetical protein ACK5PF_01480, partial [bacterium]